MAQKLAAAAQADLDPAPATLRLLGFTHPQGAAALLERLGAIGGPRVGVRQGPGLLALLQPEAPADRLGWTRQELLAGLGCVQRRLEVACQAGPFLPVDPAAACCPAEIIDDVLGAAWNALGASLAGHGRRHQWDVVLRWTPELVLAKCRTEIARAAEGRGRAGLAEAVAASLRAERSRREAALVSALEPAVLAFAPSGPAGSETEVLLTVLLPADGEASIEAALEHLPAEQAVGASVDLRGPQPPLSFTPVRVAHAGVAAVRAAWDCLGLPARADLTVLRRHWRQCAFDLHPDRQAPGPDAPARDEMAEIGLGGAGMAQATAAYRLLQDLVSASGAAGCTLGDLSRASGYRLVVPPIAVSGDGLPKQPRSPEREAASAGLALR